MAPTRTLVGLALVLQLGLSSSGAYAVGEMEEGKTQIVEANPLRGHEKSISEGATIYARVCSQCHGSNATELGPAANLRLVGRYCNRLPEPALKARCMLDADVYFRKSVEEGKVRLGIRHMPALKDELSLAQIWAVQAYIESRR